MSLSEAARRPLASVPRIAPKLQFALALMIDEGKRIDVAAQEAGITTQTLRESFDRPHVVQWVRKRKQMLRESLSTRNLLRLAEIRDAADNMPAIQAIRTLEDMSEERLSNGAIGNLHQAHGPGVTIVINGLAANAVHDDQRSRVSIEHDPGEQAAARGDVIEDKPRLR